MSAGYSPERDADMRSRSDSFSPGRKDAYSPMSPRGEEGNSNKFYEDRGREPGPDGHRSPSRSLSRSRSRSYSRSPSLGRSRSRSPRYSRSPSYSRSRSRSRSFSRSLSRGRSLSRSPGPRRGGHGGSPRSRSRGGRDAAPADGGPPGKAVPVLIAYGITADVNKEHVREIFEQYGEVGRITLSRHWAGARGKRPRAGYLAMVDFKEIADAHKACDHMNGAMIDNETIRVKVDEGGRHSGNGGGGGGRRGHRGGGRRKGGNRHGGRRGGNGRRDRDGGGRRRETRGGGGGSRYSPSPVRGRRYSRSPSPYRRRRYSRDRRSPMMRPRSPDRHRRGGAGGRYRDYGRSPSPRYGDYRGGRYGRSRSISRGRR
ncbi:hypothetical protein EV175_006087 [Coemansia sp. RSA 1933]|nr:hypothetical protein EV175_006087 [Coemansia sp. RSA 1933]